MSRGIGSVGGSVGGSGRGSCGGNGGGSGCGGTAAAVEWVAVEAMAAREAEKVAATMAAEKVVGQFIDVGDPLFFAQLFLNRINSLSFDTNQNTIH